MPSDEKNVTGTLSNGVQWIYRKHATPPGKITVMVHVRAGSLCETDAQRGLAHFLEHLAFNGTENFAPGTLVPYFESIGMTFGDNANAFTGFDQTAFYLTLPDAKPEGVEKALMILSDYVYRQLLIPAEIEKERGVILEEKRMRKDVDQRVQEEMTNRLFAGSRFAERSPIGTEEVLKNAQRDEFERFYRTWYRPERTTVLLIGDAGLDMLLPLVEKWFSKVEAKVPAQPWPGAGIQPFAAARAIVVTDPELESAAIGFTNVLPPRPPATTVPLYRAELVDDLAVWMMNRRLAERVRSGQAAFQAADVAVSGFLREGLVVAAQVEGKPEDWRKMLDELAAEVSRAKEFGFTERELALAKAEQVGDAERAVSSEETMDPRRLMFRFFRSLNDGVPVMSAGQELAILRELLPGVTVAEASGAFKARFSPDTFACALAMPKRDGLSVPTEEELLAAAREAVARKVEAAKDEGGATSLLEKEPEAGQVLEPATDEALGVTSGWLGNGVRFHVRSTDYRKDTVHLTVALAGGILEETAENAGVTEAAAILFREPATGRLSSSQVQDLLTGKQIRLSAEAETDALTARAVGSPRDLADALRLLNALLTDGRISESAFANWKTDRLRGLAKAAKEPSARAMDTLAEIVAGGDPRLMPATAERVERQTLAAAQAWLARLALEAPIEVTIVGDVKADEAIALLAKYVGSLPARPRTAERFAALRKLSRGPGPFTSKVSVETITPQGMAIFGVFGPEAKAIDEVRMLRLASNVLDTRLNKRIREELSLAYSTQAGMRPAIGIPGTGIIIGLAPCDPVKAEDVLAEAAKIFAAFAEGGPTAEELSNAKMQVLEMLDRDMREPRWWTGILEHSGLRETDLARLKTVREDYQAYSAEQVRDVFRKYFREDATFRVVTGPRKPADPPK